VRLPPDYYAFLVLEISHGTPLSFSIVQYLAVLEGLPRLAMPGIVAVRQIAHVLEREFVGFLWADQAIEAVRDADDFPLMFEKRGLHHGADDSIEAGRITAAGADSDATDIGHCTVMVKAPLVMPSRLALTLVVAPEVAVERTAPLPLVMVVITAELVLVQTTRSVMSCCWELPL